MEKNMESKRVGVVISVFNTASALLKECVESVLKQTYHNIEICLVNDGSTDEECLELLKKFARADMRVSVIHKDYNGGVSESRNLGIEWFSGEYTCAVENLKTKSHLLSFNVSGYNPYGITKIYKSKKFFAKGDNHFNAPRIDYILFLDSDDVWRENLVEECLKHANGIDVVWFNHLCVFEIQTKHIGSKPFDDSMLLDKQGVISGEDWIRHIKKIGDIGKNMTFAWRVFIDFKFLSHIGLKFVNQCFMEDNLFGVLLLYQANKIYTLPQKLIYYRVRKNSETNHTNDRENVGIPSFLDALCKQFYGNRALTREVWIYMSCYIMKLHTQDFVRENADRYGIEILDEHLTKRFKDVYLRFLHEKIGFDTDHYLNSCFNLILFLNKNYKRFRPFENFEQALCLDKMGLEGGDYALWRDVLFYENAIVVDRNKVIKKLEDKIKDLEEQNSELYLQSLQDDLNNNLKVFR